MSEQTYDLKFRIGNFRYPVQVTSQDNGKLALRFRYNPQLIEEVKVMAGARWNPEGKFWTVDNSRRNLFNIAFLTEKNPYKRYEGPLVEFKPRRYWCFFHQVEEASHILTRRQCICALEMGTGKTMAAMEAMEASGHDDWIWAAPRSALYSVKLEFERWKICDTCSLPKKAITLSDGSVIQAHDGTDHHWTTGKCVTPRFYTCEGLKKLVDEWPKDKKPPQGLVLDESSRYKNPTAQRSQAADNLANAMRDEWGDEAFVVEMSGSPSPNKPTDWWMQCEIACPGYLKEGNIQKLQKRLAVIEQRENLLTGGVYPHLICWRDSVKRCESCGQMEDDRRHDLGSGGHSFQPCKDEISGLYRRMKGLVLVKFKKDCLDLPDKQYKLIELQPSNEMLRAAQMINAKAPSAIQALTLLRELSDGFQYKEVEAGVMQCEMCKGTRTRKMPVDLDNPDEPLDGLTVQYGKRVTYDEAGTPTVTEIPVRIGHQEVACEACDGTGEVVKLARTSVPVKSPKEEALTELLDQHEDVGRMVVYGGFTGTIDKIVELVKRADWNYIRVDGRGWDSSLRGYHPLRMLEAFQSDRNIDRICFIGQPSSAGMGLNLTASPTIVYYSNDFNAESRIQSEDRIHRAGMDKNRGATIYDLVLLPSDLLVLNNLKRKRRLQDLSLGQMRDEIAAIKFSDIRSF